MAKFDQNRIKEIVADCMYKVTDLDKGVGFSDKVKIVTLQNEYMLFHTDRLERHREEVFSMINILNPSIKTGVPVIVLGLITENTDILAKPEGFDLVCLALGLNIVELVQPKHGESLPFGIPQVRLTEEYINKIK